MNTHRFRTPFDQDLERRDDRLDLLKRQLATAYERADYVRAETLSDEIARVRAEREAFRQSRDALLLLLESFERSLNRDDEAPEVV